MCAFRSVGPVEDPCPLQAELRVPRREFTEPGVHTLGVVVTLGPGRDLGELTQELSVAW
jgi:hypothetical protein